MKTVWYGKLKVAIKKLNAFIDRECTPLKLLILVFVIYNVYSIIFTINTIAFHDFENGDWYDYFYHGPHIFIIKVRILFLFQLLRFPFHRLLLFAFGSGGFCLFISKYILEASQANHHNAIIDADFFYATLACMILLLLALSDKYVHLIADKFSVWNILLFYFIIELIFNWPPAAHIQDIWPNSNVRFRFDLILLHVLMLRFLFVYLRTYLKRRKKPDHNHPI